jgi:hypothetical protein
MDAVAEKVAVHSVGSAVPAPADPPRLRRLPGRAQDRFFDAPGAARLMPCSGWMSGSVTEPVENQKIREGREVPDDREFVAVVATDDLWDGEMDAFDVNGMGC